MAGGGKVQVVVSASYPTANIAHVDGVDVVIAEILNNLSGASSESAVASGTKRPFVSFYDPEAVISDVRLVGVGSGGTWNGTLMRVTLRSVSSIIGDHQVGQPLLIHTLGSEIASWVPINDLGHTSQDYNISYPGDHLAAVSSLGLYAVWEANPDFNLTGTIGAHGSASPTVPSTFKFDDLTSFTVTPDAGYKVKLATIDGTDVTTSISAGPIGYPGTSVMPAHDVVFNVSFESLSVKVKQALYIEPTTDCPAGMNVVSRARQGNLIFNGDVVTGVGSPTYTSVFRSEFDYSPVSDSLDGFAMGAWAGQQVKSLTVGGVEYAGSNNASVSVHLPAGTFPGGADIEIIAVISTDRQCAINIITPPDQPCPKGTVWSGTACVPVAPPPGGGHDCSKFGPDYYWDEALGACTKATKLTGQIQVVTYLDNVACPMTISGAFSGSTPATSGELTPGVYSVTVSDGITRVGTQTVLVVANSVAYVRFDFFTDGRLKGRIRATTYVDGWPYPLTATINGVGSGLTPVTSGELSPGDYVVSVTNSGELTGSKTVSAVAGQTTEARFDFRSEDLNTYGRILVQSFYEFAPYRMTASIAGNIIGQTEILSGKLVAGTYTVAVTDGHGLTGTKSIVVVADQTSIARFDFFSTDEPGGPGNGLRVMAQFAGEYLSVPFTLTDPSSVVTSETTPYAADDVATGVWSASTPWRGSTVTGSATAAASGIRVIILNLPGDPPTLSEEDLLGGSTIPDGFQVRWKDESGPWSPWREIDLGLQGHDEPFRWLAPMGIYRHRQYEFRATGISPVAVAWVEEDVESFAPEVPKEVRE